MKTGRDHMLYLGFLGLILLISLVVPWLQQLFWFLIR